MSWAAIVAAAGRGERFGRPKQLVELAEKPMLAWSLETFAAMHEVEMLVVATEPELVARVAGLVQACAPGARAYVVPGGRRRQDSVRLALAEVARRGAGRITRVLVHDGARPMIRADDVRRGMAVVEPGVGAVLAVPVIDTIKQVDSANKVLRTLERSQLWAAQTPQFATLEDLQRAHREADRYGAEATDDAALLERAGVEVIAVQGSPENFKVTLPADLARAEVILRERMAV
jgi:2-C-methyl-D-erythritol 4-phosphate cytidylyltransferase